jgi:hypothetical protein
MGKPGTALQNLRTKFERQGEVAFLEFEQSAQILAQLKSGEAFLLICSVTDRKHILDTISTLKSARAHLIHKRLKVMVLSSINQPQILSKFQENGAQDIMTEPIGEKALELKIKRHVHAVQKQRLASAGATPRAVKSKAKAASAEVEKKRAQSTEQAKRSDPLTLQSDCWLLLSGVGKRVMGKWIFNLAGPAPTVARWVENKSAGTDESLWVWTPNQDDGRFIKEKGSWVFRGQRPEVRGDVWAFVGKSPELAFVTPEGQTIARRLYCDEKGQLFIAKDSSVALSQLALIHSTWDKIIKSKAEAEAEKQEIRAKKKKGENPDDPEEQEDLSADPIALESVEDGTTPQTEDSPSESLDQSELLAAAKEAEAIELEPAQAIERNDFTFTEEKRASKELRGEFEADPLSPELEATQEGPGAGVELNGVFKKEAQGPELEAQQEGAGPGRELGGVFDGEPESPELRGERGAQAQSPELKGPDPEPSREIAPVLEAALSPKAEDTPELKAELDRLSAVAKNEKLHTPEPQEKSPKKTERKEFTPEMAQSRTTPFDPQLTGVALVFLAAEQVCKTGRSVEQMAAKFCEYVNTSLAGTAVELWCLQKDGSLKCVGSDLGSRGTLESLAREGFEGMQSTTAWFKSKNAGNGVVPLESKTDGARVCLALSGVCIESMTEDYARSLQVAARGIALGLLEMGASGEKAAA